ncbi:MAG: TIGR01244 family sulfur transferase [Pseudohongiellaceae bacterium]|nr:TIGR01244 family sulfur transferase [Pseudohongiellaceae bacterium]
MDVRKVTDDMSVSPQITVDDVKQAAAQGFRSLMCNRPDAESPDQTDFAQFEVEARNLGLEVAWVPVVSGKITAADVQAFSQAYDSMPKPLLAYCRTGTRSITLWALAQGAKGVPAQQILACGSAAGYDLSDTVQLIQASR